MILFHRRLPPIPAIIALTTTTAMRTTSTKKIRLNQGVKVNHVKMEKEVMAKMARRVVKLMWLGADGQVEKHHLIIPRSHAQREMEMVTSRLKALTGSETIPKSLRVLIATHPKEEV